MIIVTTLKLLMSFMNGLFQHKKKDLIKNKKNRVKERL